MSLLVVQEVQIPVEGNADDNLVGGHAQATDVLGGEGDVEVFEIEPIQMGSVQRSIVVGEWQGVRTMVVVGHQVDKVHQRCQLAHLVTLVGDVDDRRESRGQQQRWPTWSKFGRFFIETSSDRLE